MPPRRREAQAPSRALEEQWARWNSEFPPGEAAIPNYPWEPNFSSGPWGLEARGVAIRRAGAKGSGAYCVRRITCGSVVGIYRGELLTEREMFVRHCPQSLISPRGPCSAPTFSEQATMEERVIRLSALPADVAPRGGSVNDGAYILALLPETWHPLGVSAPAYIDGEDPNRSSWCRFLNHAPQEMPGEPVSSCNLQLLRDGRRHLAWFVARRDVEEGEELLFDYGAFYHTRFQM
mmetsp:Transcript_57013/g.127292  ORF Transcript_57013/g.127292 Transcript_57013/m.127292 type:complete len:235 (-) Transcript_57013:737-1441(-)